MNDRIRELQEQIAREKDMITNCSHDYGEPFSNPEKVREPYGIKTVGRGSDIWSEPEGYRDVEKPRWTRICRKCGNEQHTTKQKPIVSDYKPDFD